VPPEHVDERFRWYRATVVDAEVAPGTVVRLNGPGAGTAWPFTGTVVVLTAYDPGGVRADPAANEAADGRLADAVREHGGEFVRGAGTAVDGSHSEPSLVVTGLSRATAVELGRRFGQDAIFELDATTMSLVSCLDDRVETWARVG
jgi:hypothetical protein